MIPGGTIIGYDKPTATYYTSAKKSEDFLDIRLDKIVNWCWYKLWAHFDSTHNDSYYYIVAKIDMENSLKHITYHTISQNLLH